MNQKLFRLTLLAIIIIGIALGIIFREQLNPAALQNWIENAGNAGPLIFMLIYIIGTVFFLPGSLLTLLGGALFGPIAGTFINLTAATIGAMISFLVSRFLAANWVAQKIAGRNGNGRLQQIMNGVENEGWRFVAFTRLVPLFPFNLLNYALGLTKISFSQYSIATFICMLPAAFAYTYLGYIGKEAATGGEDLIQKAMLALALLAIVAFIPRLVNHLRSGPMIDIDTLKQRIDAAEDILLLDVRTEKDYMGEQGHIHGSVLIPVEELEQRLDELKDYREKPVITICRTDRKSAKAAQTLLKKGFTDVHIAKMGMTDWIKNGYAIETDRI